MQAKTKAFGTLAALVVLVVPIAANAVYNDNITGIISHVRVYDTGLVLVRLQNQPTSHPACQPGYFAMDTALDPDIRAMMLSRALVARASGQPINIGYDNAGSCAQGYIRLHQIGDG